MRKGSQPHSQTREARTNPYLDQRESFPAPWTSLSPYLLAGLPWLEAWLKIWQLAANLQYHGERPTDGAEEVKDDRRRDPEAPWLPRIESTVIPLCRRTDPPGSEAARITMRFSVPNVPWAGTGGNVIVLDTLLPRRASATKPVPTSSTAGVSRRPKGTPR